MTVSASRKELSSKADGFHERENPSIIIGMKNSLKNPFPRYGKTGSSGKKIENGFRWQKNIFLLKLIPLNINHGFQQQKKVPEQKHTVSNRHKISFHELE